MGRDRLLFEQLSSPVEEVIGSLRTWPDEELFRAGHAISYELLRRRRPIPVAWPVAEAAATICPPSQVTLPTAATV